MSVRKLTNLLKKDKQYRRQLHRKEETLVRCAGFVGRKVVVRDAPAMKALLKLPKWRKEWRPTQIITVNADVSLASQWMNQIRTVFPDWDVEVGEPHCKPRPAFNRYAQCFSSYKRLQRRYKANHLVLKNCRNQLRAELAKPPLAVGRLVDVETLVGWKANFPEEHWWIRLAGPIAEEGSKMIKDQCAGLTALVCSSSKSGFAQPESQVDQKGGRRSVTGFISSTAGPV